MKNKNIFKELIIQGLIWLLPFIVIVMVITWVYKKIDLISNSLLSVVGINPEHNSFLWLLLTVTIFLIILVLIGFLVESRLAKFFENMFKKVPGYSIVKDIIGIFNSSKDGQTKVLVVAIKGFAKEGYNIGLMYSQSESIIQNHYTVTLSQTPIPNGGYLFEVHKDNIFILEEASFDDNLQYLLSMGVKSLTEIIGIKPKSFEELIPLTRWLDENNKNNK